MEHLTKIQRRCLVKLAQSHNGTQSLEGFRLEAIRSIFQLFKLNYIVKVMDNSFPNPECIRITRLGRDYLKRY